MPKSTGIHPKSLDRLVCDARPDTMANPSRLEQYASSQGMQTEWRITPFNGGYRADVRIGFLNGAMPWWHSDGATEQLALDGAIDNAISYWAAVLKTD
jgi:hypothetical protein